MTYVFARYIPETRQWVWDAGNGRWASNLAHARLFDEWDLAVSDHYGFGDKCLLPLETANVLARENSDGA